MSPGNPGQPREEEAGHALFSTERLSLRGDQPVASASAPCQTLCQFDSCAHGIDDEGELQPELSDLAVRHLEGDAGGFQLLAERLEPLDLEADVIDCAAPGRCLSIRRLNDVDFTTLE